MNGDPLKAGFGENCCRLCNGKSHFLFSQTVLSKYEIKYFQCGQCDLIQTEKPFWLAEAYHEAISALDTGLIARNIECRNLLLKLFSILRFDHPRCVDFGGGSGVFVRLMRDAGHDFFWLDKYAKNLFARGFEANLSYEYKVVTSLEVLEHLDDAYSGLCEIFGFGADCVIVSTVLHQGHSEGWWYYAPLTGQHIAFYSEKTMEYIAKKFEMNVIAASGTTMFYSNRLVLNASKVKLLKKVLEGNSAPGSLGERFCKMFRNMLFRSKLSKNNSFTISDHFLLTKSLGRCETTNDESGSQGYSDIRGET